MEHYRINFIAIRKIWVIKLPCLFYSGAKNYFHTLNKNCYKNLFGTAKSTLIEITRKLLCALVICRK